MANNSAFVRAYGDSLQAVSTAALGTTAPTVPMPTPLAAGWYPLGWIDDNGITENAANAETKHYAWQGNSLIATIRYQNEHSFEFLAAERNLAVLTLDRRSSPSTVAGTNEVQTVTITGAPTGGTFTLTYSGQTTSNIAYNATGVAVQTALASLPAIGSGNVTVTGAGPYAVAFVNALAARDVPVLVGSAAGLTGGTPGVTVTTTTPGVPAVNTWPVGAVSATNIRQWVIDMGNGPVHTRLYIPNGEAVVTGPKVYQGKDITTTPFRVDCYPDASGQFVYDINDDPAQVGVFV
ncbi:MAG: hypothetical protein ACR2GG_10595 [Gemmatimonadaceae bacterium]